MAVAVDDMALAARDSPLALSRTAQLLRTLLALAPVDRHAVVTRRLDWITAQLAERHPDFRHGTGG